MRKLQKENRFLLFFENKINYNFYLQNFNKSFNCSEFLKKIFLLCYKTYYLEDFDFYAYK